MKRLPICIVVGCCLFWPVLAQAGEQEVKAMFLLQGGIGGILIGAGLYAGFMVLAAVLFKRKATVAVLFALSVAFYVYTQYWSIYFLAIAWNFMRTGQMRYAFGEPTTHLAWVLLLVVAWGLAVLGVTLRLWISRNQDKQAAS